MMGEYINIFNFFKLNENICNYLLVKNKLSDIYNYIFKVEKKSLFYVKIISFYLDYF